MSHERVKAFAEGRSDDLDSLVTVCPVSQSDFVSSKLTESLEKKMVSPLTASAGAMPSWCSQLMAECSFLFSFEERNKNFLLTVLRSPLFQSSTFFKLCCTNDGCLRPSKCFSRKRKTVKRSVQVWVQF